MTIIYYIVSIGKECDNNEQYVMAISYSKEILENMIKNIPPSNFEFCNYIIKENSIPIYSLKRIDADIFLTKLYTVNAFNIDNLYAFNKINFSGYCQNVLLDITGFDINEVRTFNIFKNDLSENNILFDTFYDEGIMNA